MNIEKKLIKRGIISKSRKRRRRRRKVRKGNIHFCMGLSEAQAVMIYSHDVAVSGPLWQAHVTVHTL